MNYMQIRYRVLLLLLVVIMGCATIQSRWEKVSSTDTIEAYEAFLRQYPNSEFAEKARARIEELYYQKAKVTNTIEAYQQFKRNYPSGKFAVEAEKNLALLKQQLQALEDATQKVIPSGTKVEVTSVSRFPNKPQFVIAAHLLEGHSADENSPYIRGDYGTHEKLVRLVRLRCAEILKSIANENILPDGSELVISTRHGVREYYSPSQTSGTDVAMTIYEISVAMEVLKTHTLATMNEVTIMDLWSVTKNIISELEFKTDWIYH